MTPANGHHERRGAGGSNLTPRVIGICSWQRGFCHGTFNAGLVHVASAAFPGHQIRFHAEESHVPFLRDVLLLSKPGIPDGLEIIGHELGMPRTTHGFLQRFKLLFQIVQAMRRNEVTCWIFADMGGSSLKVLRYLMRLGRVAVPVVVIAHGLFEPLGWSQTSGPDELTGLQGPSVPNLRLVVLGEHIFDALREYPTLRQHDIRLLPHPVLDLATSAATGTQSHRFVFPGVPDKGLTSFASLAAEIRVSHPEATFSVAGFAPSERDSISMNALADIATSPLSIEEYLGRLSAASYGIWFTMHTPDPYQYRASGTIPDLISCGRPAIFMRNRMVDSYFSRFGALGYCCDSWSDLVERVKHMTLDQSDRMTSEHRATVEIARQSLLPQSLAPVLREIVLAPKNVLPT
jgi:hypothetical protein